MVLQNTSRIVWVPPQTRRCRLVGFACMYVISNSERGCPSLCPLSTSQVPNLQVRFSVLPIRLGGIIAECHGAAAHSSPDFQTPRLPERIRTRTKSLPIRDCTAATVSWCHALKRAFQVDIPHVVLASGWLTQKLGFCVCSVLRASSCTQRHF